MDFSKLASELATAGPLGVIVCIITAIVAIASGKVRLPREVEREIEARKLIEAELAVARERANTLQGQLDREHEQKLRTLELLLARRKSARSTDGLD